MGGRRWWVLSTLLLALMPFTIDVAVVLPALPHLPASRQAAPLLAAAYPLTLALLLPATSRIAGVRRLLLAGLTTALVGTLVESFADTAAVLLVGRVVFGAGAALALPAALRTVQAAFDPAEHVRAVAIWAGFSGLAVALGPWLAGGLIEGHGGGSVFALQVPLLALGLPALAAILPAVAQVPVAAVRAARDVSGPAAVLALVATAAALSFRLQPDWSPSRFGLLLLVPVTAFAIAARYRASLLGLLAVAASVAGLAVTGDAGLVLLVTLGLGAASAVGAAPGSAIARLLAVALGLASAALPTRVALITAAAASVLALATDLLQRRRHPEAVVR